MLGGADPGILKGSSGRLLRTICIGEKTKSSPKGGRGGGGGFGPFGHAH